VLHPLCVLIAPPPIAYFVYSDNGYTVTFTDSSSSATSWWWDFGDAQFSNLQSPVHTYGDTGTYTVCLTVTDSCGSDTFCTTISITVPCEPPVAGFNVDSINGTTAFFTDVSTNATTWWWDFGDAQFSSSQNPSHTFQDTGWYYVCLTITDSCGSDTICDSIYVSSGVGIQEYGQQQFSIHPNPTTGVFTVVGATGEIQVHDLFGRLVFSTTLPQIDMSYQPKGVYFVRAGQAVRKLMLN